MDKHDGGPAFPAGSVSQNQATGETVLHQPFGGMTLRDYFAGEALPIAYEACGPNKQGWNGIAQVAYAIADAMLKARAA
jgi:hypothetical protein